MARSFLQFVEFVSPRWVSQVARRLASSGAVTLADVTEQQCVGIAQVGDIDYRVTIDGFANPASAAWRCACRPVLSSPKCVHVVAVAVELDALLASLDQSMAVGAGSAEVAPAVPRQKPRGVPEWRRRLQRLLPVASAIEESQLPHIEYYVEVRPDDARARLRIHVRERATKKNGERGGPRMPRLVAASLERCSREDQILLRQAKQAVGRSYYGHDPFYDPDDGVSLTLPWTVPAPEIAGVLPLLARTGRVFQAPVPPADVAPVPLAIDVEPPFHFELDADSLPATRAKHRMVFGKFTRGGAAFVLRDMTVHDHDYLLLDGRLLAVDCHGAHGLATNFATQGPIEVPEQDLPELLAGLARVRGASHFLATAITQLPASAPIGVVLVTFPQSPKVPLRASLQFDYEGALVVGSDERPIVQVGAGIRRRDVTAEQELRAKAVEAGLVGSPAGELGCTREEFASVAGRLVTAGLRVLAEGKRLRAFRSGAGAVRSGIDWLEVEGAFEFDGKSSTLPELLRRKVTPEGFVELDDGSFGILPVAWLRQVETLRLLGGAAEGDVVRLPNSQALLLDAMLQARREDDPFVVDAQFAALRQRLAAFTKVAPVQEPTSFQGELRPYQRDGLGWLAFLREFGLGGCLADDMGLGKTVQVLAMLSQHHGAGAAAPASASESTGKRGKRVRQAAAPVAGARPSILVAPRSVLGNWLAEASRFAPSLRVVDFSGVERWRDGTVDRLADCDLVLTTYALARADAAEFVERNLHFHWAILDEAQAIKNADSLSSKAVRLLRARNRLVLTGTPVENHLGDLWSLFEFLNPGMLGRLPAFRALFGKDTSTEAMAEHRDVVQRALRPVLLRRTKAQVLKDLPDKVEQTLWCEMAPPQKKRYEQMKAHYRNRLLAGPGELDDKQRFVVLEALLRLRQAAIHEGLLDPRAQAAESAKFEELLPRLEELAAEGHKALVFSQFTSVLDLLEPQLRQRSLVWERLDGSTRKRTEKVERFQTDAKCPLFLISLKAGGYGLNLTAASYVFLLDPWWNPAVEMQAIDRSHRIGQKHTVNAYRIVCRGTVEERVLELQAQKKALCEAILGNERSLLQDLSRSDLELLLG